MTEIRRYTAEQYASPLSGKVQIFRAQREHGPYVLWEDHRAEVERLKADIARLTRERDEARATR